MGTFLGVGLLGAGTFPDAGEFSKSFKKLIKKMAAKMNYFSSFFKKYYKPCVNFSGVWTKNTK